MESIGATLLKDRFFKVWLAGLSVLLAVGVGFHLFSKVLFVKKFSNTIGNGYPATGLVEIGQVKLFKFITKKAYLPTKDGEYVLGGVSYYSGQVAPPNLYYLDDKIRETPSSLYFFQGGAYESVFKRYDKKTQEISNFPLPIPSNELSPTAIVRIAPINEKLSLFSIYKSEEPILGYEAFLYNEETNEFKRVKDLEGNCNIIYCGSPYSVKQISDIRALVFQGGADGCWNAGIVTLLNLQNLSTKLVLRYDYGCMREKDAYVGMLSDKRLVTASHISASLMDELAGEIYTSVSTVDPMSGNKQVIITAEEMPKGVKDIRMDKDDILLFTSDTSAYRYSSNVGVSSGEQSINTSDYPAYYEENLKRTTPYKISEKEEELKDVMSVLAEKIQVDGSQNLAVTYPGGSYVSLINTNSWGGFYFKYIDYEGHTLDYCNPWTFKFSNAVLDRQSKVVKFNVSVVPPVGPFVKCKVSTQPKNFDSVIDLISGKVYLLKN